MAGEVQFSFRTGTTCYFQVRNRISQIWSTSGGTGGFASYLTAAVADYDVAAVEQGTASAYYVGTFPTGITTPGVYSVVVRNQLTGFPAESDPVIMMGDYCLTGRESPESAGAQEDTTLEPWTPGRKFI